MSEVAKVTEIKAKADRLAKLTTQQDKIKGEIETLKAWFEMTAQEDLKDTKRKTIEYWGTGNTKVVVFCEGGGIL